jgi:hypothetical protein
VIGSHLPEPVRSAAWFVRDVLRLPPGRQEETADAVWASMHVQNYRLLVLERGWAVERYERWLARMLAAVVDDQIGRVGP